MTTELAHFIMEDSGGEPGGRPTARKVFRAQLWLCIERSAPAAIMGAMPLTAIVTLGLFDFWRFAGLWGHAAALVLLIALAAVLFWRRRPSPFWPSRDDALARLERDGAMRHEPLRALEDSPASGAGVLWSGHIEDSRARATSARLLAPAPTANAVDPFGLRYAILGVLLIGIIAAGDAAPQRFVDAFRPRDQSIARGGFAELWIEPPGYTGKAPVYLLRSTDSLGGLHDEIDAPEGSIVRIQTKAGARFRLALTTSNATVKAAREGGDKSASASLVLVEAGILTLSAGGLTARWPITIIEDIAPKIEFSETPAPDRDGRLTVAAAIDDDYGATAVLLELRLDAGQPRPLDAPLFAAETATKIELIPLDGLKGPSGARKAAVDLSAHPWAGLSVIAAVKAADAAGQEGRSPPVRLTLPAREFYNPLAKAVIEQRQTLAVAPSDWRRVEWALSGMTLGPEYFFDRPTDYLLVRTAMWRVNKRGGEDQRSTVDEFWPLALQLEDQTLELARQRLNAARSALRDALENGAPDPEIERLTESLREALQDYLESLAQSGAETDPNAPPADQIVTAADLDSMLDAVRNLAKSGAANAARQALAELEQLLENLRAPGGSNGAEGGTGRSGQQGKGGQAGQVGDLIGRQRSLADETYRRSETNSAVGDDLGEEESVLAGDLAEFMQSLDDDSDVGGKALSRALSAMRRAEDALTGEDFDGARGAMEEAIANLRDGAEALAEAERAMAQGAQGRGGQPLRDPLGRPIGEATGQGVDVPEKSEAQRARELLEELRRRLSNGERTEDEIKYLERLLDRF